MHKGLYSKLALSSLKNNGRFYYPYLCACVGTIMMFFVLLSLCMDPAMAHISGGAQVVGVLSLGTGVVAIFSAAILYYASGVLAKHRKKEFGLYNILGMEKRHIGRMLFRETIYTALVALVGGIGLGIVFSKLLQLILLRILNCKVPFGVNISWTAVAITTVLFAAIFLLIFFRQLVVLIATKPIDLLHASQQGEREPKSNWLIALLGVASLAIGYIMAVTTQGAVYAISLFFVAVMFVIVGTFLTFTAFSIVLLKILRRNKKYYYKSAHFATISGMLYRMKRNAAGLANICILSTMALIAVSTTVCLYMGATDINNQMYPNSISVRYRDSVSPETEKTIIATAEDQAAKAGLTIRNRKNYSTLSFAAIKSGADLKVIAQNAYQITGKENAVMVCVASADTYHTLTGKTIAPQAGEAYYFFDDTKAAVPDAVTLLDHSFRVTPLSAAPIDSEYKVFQIHTVMLIVSDNTTVEELAKAQQAVYGDQASKITYMMQFDLNGTDKQQSAFAASLSKAASIAAPGGMINCKVDQLQDSMTYYGTFLFIGIFLGLLFAMATVLIIYYKQISEGYDDRNRFEIMQKVGMTRREVKATIHSQVLIVFFLPLLTAALHIVFAFPMVSKILGAFGMMNTTLFIGCTGGTLLIFAVLYTLVYTLTSRTYYRIVSPAKNA